MNDLTKVFIDLSKCTEEQIKSLPQILEKAGETLGDQIDFEGDDLSYWTNFHKPDYATYWTCGTSNSTPGKTELTYDEFIKLVEGGEGEKKSRVEMMTDQELQEALRVETAELEALQDSVGSIETEIFYRRNPDHRR